VRLDEAWGKPYHARAWAQKFGLADPRADVFAEADRLRHSPPIRAVNQPECTESNPESNGTCIKLPTCSEIRLGILPRRRSERPFIVCELDMTSPVMTA
jgi:hypothetical protein